MTDQLTRTGHTEAIDHVVQQIAWQSHKRTLQILSQPQIALTMPQMITLFAIHEARICRMSELADVTQQSAGTLTGIVDRLIEDDLVGRVRDVEDRRVVQVTLTPTGRARVALVQEVRQAEMDHVLQHFSFEQRADLETLLTMLLSSFEAPRSHTTNASAHRSHAYPVAARAALERNA